MCRAFVLSLPPPIAPLPAPQGASMGCDFWPIIKHFLSPEKHSNITRWHESPQYLGWQDEADAGGEGSNIRTEHPWAVLALA